MSATPRLSSGGHPADLNTEGYREKGMDSSSPSSEGELDETDLEYAAAQGQRDDLARVQSQAHSFLAPKLSLPHEIVFVGIICCAQLTTQASMGPSLSIGREIGRQFGVTSAADVAWYLAAYALTIGTFILICGRLGDLFGHKRMLVIGYTWYAVWTMICGLSVFSDSGNIMMIVCRAFQGVGPSILLPNGLAILGGSYPDGPRKHMVFALFGAMAPGGCALGCAMAGVFELAWWPWAFWSFAIALLCLAGAAQLIIPDSVDAHASSCSFFDKLKQLDAIGGTVGVSALILINIAWNQAPIVGWSEPYTYILLIIGILLVPLFFWIELRWSSYPLLPLEALKSGDIAFVLGCLACGWGSFGTWLFYNWQWFLEIRGETGLMATAYFSPVSVSGAVAAVVTGIVLGKIGPAWTVVCAMSAFFTGNMLLVTRPMEQTYWTQSFLTYLITPWGMDMIFPASTVILSNAVGRRHQGIAASLINTVVNYSISIGLGFATTAEVYVNKGGTSKEELLKGYKAACWVAVGLTAFGLMLSVVYLMVDITKKRRVGRAVMSEVEEAKR
ncbi:major facilitator superfamily domain-containing protein [Neurospora hispaniola]|uniref:Major facilitator superfamily domain-containing protein n=1 Tax=Neurospora hispaniola TaxID=588809 RepID=A0AAJ0MRF1_9PEZI|nr:major facilitator superfamily domain-containing protein [Neurospora hispaniola]